MFPGGGLVKTLGVYITICIAIGLGLALVFWLPSPLEASHSSAGPSVIEVTVGPGDTVWDIARQYGGADDPRRLIHWIGELNDLEGYRIYPGQRILVPTDR